MWFLVLAGQLDQSPGEGLDALLVVAGGQYVSFLSALIHAAVKKADRAVSRSTNTTSVSYRGVVQNKLRPAVWQGCSLDRTSARLIREAIVGWGSGQN